MSFHSGPEGVAPDDQRCEALVRGTRHAYWRWMREDRRCPRRAQQMRDGMAVCYSHSLSKKLVGYGPQKVRWSDNGRTV